MPTDVDVRLVFVAWRKTRPRPEHCRFSPRRRKLIRARLKDGYSVRDLVAVIRYANESDEGWPRWMQGHNPRGRQYLDLENLLRAGKLDERIELALAWCEAHPESLTLAPPDGVELGPLALFRGSPGDA